MSSPGGVSDTSILRAVDIAFRYGDSPAIGPLSVDLGVGLHRLGGSNGAGKSTLLRCLCGDFQPSGGTVRVLGRDPVGEVAARRLVGFAPYPDDLPDFLSVERCWRSIAAFRGCPDWDGHELARRLALPSDLRLGQGSAGQRRKAGLLVALVGDPPVLLLDEPWAAIDADGIDIVTELMESRRTTNVVLFTSHGDCPVDIDSEHVLVSPRFRAEP